MEEGETSKKGKDKKKQGEPLRIKFKFEAQVASAGGEAASAGGKRKRRESCESGRTGESLSPAPHRSAGEKGIEDMRLGKEKAGEAEKQGHVSWLSKAVAETKQVEVKERRQLVSRVWRESIDQRLSKWWMCAGARARLQGMAWKEALTMPPAP